MDKLNKKFIIFIGAIVGATVLLIVFIAIFRSCTKKTNDYSSAEKKMISAAKKYYKKNKDKKPALSENTSVSVSELVEDGFMKPLSEYLIDSSCTGEVSVYNNGGQFQIIPDLKCAEYETVHFADKVIKDNLVTSSTDDDNEISENSENSSDDNTPNIETIDKDYLSGLYYMDGVYVFRGKSPNNYVKFAKTTWRILDIDSKGVVRIIKNDVESKQLRWDTKFNSDVSRSYGINDYKNSLLLEELNIVYNKVSNSTKVHFIPFDVCVGKRDSKNLSIDRNLDCSTILKTIYISYKC